MVNENINILKCYEFVWYSREEMSHMDKVIVMKVNSMNSV